MKRTRIIPLLTAILFTVSCGSTGGENAVTDGATKDPTGTTEVETEAFDFTKAVEKRDFGGTAFRILGRNDGDMSALHAYELSTDSENGDIINDAVFHRNKKVGEYFNITFETELVGREESLSLVRNSVLAGDKAYDLVWGFVGTMSSLAVSGCLDDFASYDMLSLESEWWNQPAREGLTVEGKLLLAFNDIPFTSMLSTHCLFMNKRVADDLGVKDVYKTVSNGKWTLDTLLTLTADRKNDLNGDGNFDENDTYGFISSYGASGIFTTGCAVSVLKVNGREIELTLMNDKTQSVIEKVYRLAYDNNSTYIVDNSLEKTVANMFSNGQSLFYSGFLADPLSYFRDMKDDFALLPLPKYDENQDSYYTTISGGNGMLGIPVDVRDRDMTGLVTEALAIESYQNIRPAVLETVMIGKLLRDDESVDIFDMIISGIKVDFAFLYTGKGYGRTLRDLLMKQSTDLSSYYAEREAAAIDYYNEVIQSYLEK